MSIRLLACSVALATGLAIVYPLEVDAIDSDPEEVHPAGPERPRIGLVLSGGGAKGGAHVGVLKVLEELRVPIDCIAGTSMGALVGAGYASGLTADTMREFVTGIDWKSVVGGVGQRELLSVEQKRAGVTYANDFEFGLQDGKVMIPGGLVRTAAIDNLLRTFVAQARMQSDFDKLPIPFRAVATDMLTGTMVVLDGGDIATAMRASMAIPGAFSPVITDDYILSDGGMVRNLPVDVARELCADVVIVVNLVEPDIPREKLQSATQLANRSTGIMIEANVELQLRTLTEDDVRIDVYMGDIGTSSFERIPETLPLGEAAARAASQQLAALSVSPERYAAWRERVTAVQDMSVRLAAVRFEDLERVNPAYLEAHARIGAGDTVDIGDIGSEALRMSAESEFESVEYRLEWEEPDPTLVWQPREKPWGPNYLKFDFGMYGSSGGSLAFALYGKHTRSWLNSLGGEWRNEAQLGYETKLSTALYQPLEVTQVFFVEPSVAYTRTLEDVYLDDDLLATYTFQDLGGRLDFGVNMGRDAQARVGYLYTARDTSVRTGSPALPELDVDDASWVAELTYDTRDTPFNPTRGIGAVLLYQEANSSIGGDRDWELAELGISTAVPFRNDVLRITIAGGTDFGSDLPVDRAFALGGPGSFPGYELGQLRGNDYWTASASYLWKLRDIFTIRQHALYGGLQLQAGRVYNRFELSEDEGEIFGLSVYVTGRTIVGPVTLGVGTTSTDTWSAWLGLGRPIGHGTVLDRGIFR